MVVTIINVMCDMFGWWYGMGVTIVNKICDVVGWFWQVLLWNVVKWASGDSYWCEVVDWWWQVLVSFVVWLVLGWQWLVGCVMGWSGYASCKCDVLIGKLVVTAVTSDVVDLWEQLSMWCGELVGTASRLVCWAGADICLCNVWFGALVVRTVYVMCDVVNWLWRLWMWYAVDWW